MRIGTGFDVHAFGPGDYVTLGNIKIPYKMGFQAHSDGDVLIHAICDALLGATALGDIGQHFPPDDPQWADCDSAVFLTHCLELITQAGWKIANIDTVIMAEQPKIKPHIEAITGRLAEIMQLDLTQVGIKATTTEKLGFVGRGEGIAAQAVCLLQAR
jgi:2-C-methyl-D-erythritol 2,4-cyclodiphosphate synthase